MRAILFLWVCLALQAKVQSETLFVGGQIPPPCNSCWFLDIQSAIDAASDGDIILVRPGTYDPFTIEKAVLVKASEGQFRIENTEPIRIRNVSTGRVGVVGAIYDWTICDAWWLCDFFESVCIENCTAEVVLGDFTAFSGTELIGSEREISIFNCSNVSLNNVTTEEGLVVQINASHQAVLIQSSRVRITESYIRGDGSFDVDGGEVAPAGVGIRAIDSSVVISRTNVIGGSGFFSFLGGAADGAHGVEATDSEVIIIGDGSQVIEGGLGPWIPDFVCIRSGDGLHVMGTGSAIVSQVTLQHGKSCPEKEGEDWVGNVSFDSRIPYLFGNGDLNPGDTLSVTTGGSETGLAVVFMSLLSDFVTLENFVGPPLATVLLAGSSAILPVGVLVGGSELTVHCPIPFHESFQGLKIELQMALLGASDLFLSNAHTVVIGE